MRKWILFSIFVVLAVFQLRSKIVGMILEPRLEKVLTRLFDMPVTIDGLRADPLTGHVTASRVIFMNQPQFEPGSHLDTRGLYFDIDFLALTKKHVLISDVFLDQPLYFIDRIATPNGPTNNVITWVDHIEGDDEEDHGPPPPPGTSSSGWKVTIHKITLRNGTFIFHDRSSKEAEKKLVFNKLNGYLLGFEWPTRDPEELTQRVKLEGTFGEKYPAPFSIDGGANFATGQVSFDLKGEIKEGNVLDHSRFWEGTPIKVQDGKFQLKMHVICVRRQLTSKNTLKLKSLKVSPGPAATDKVWGLPMLGFIGFLQNEKEISLKIPVNGYIADPKFEFTHAFVTAFRKSFKTHAVSGIKHLKNGTAKIAVQTGEIVRETPTRLAEGIEKMTTMVTNAVPPIIDPNNRKEKLPSPQPSPSGRGEG